MSKVVLLYSPYVGTRFHSTSYLLPVCRLLAHRGRFRPLLVTGRSYPAGQNADGFEVVSLDVDMSREEAERFLRYGPLAKPLRGLTRIALSVRGLRQLRQLINQRRGVDILHIVDCEYFTLGRFLQRAADLSVKLVVTIHQSDFRRRELSWRSLYKKAVRGPFRTGLRKADAIVVHGETIRDRLVEELRLSGQEAHRIFVARYPQGDSRAALDKVAARRHLGIPPNERVVLLFGMIRADKRIDIAIQAVAQARSKPFLVIAGTPWTLPAEAVQGWVRENQIEGRSLLHLRWIQDDEIHLYYSAADLFLSTQEPGYVSQSGPLNMCRPYRLPAVVSDTGELGYYVRQAGVGLLAKPGDVRSFAHQIDCFFASEPLQQELSLAVEAAAEAFSWDYFVGRLEACYGSVLEQAP